MLVAGGSGSNAKPIFGSDETAIDAKGRLLISKRKREWLGDSFVLVIGDTGCLMVYRTQEWEELVSKVMSFPAFNQGRQQYTRLVLASCIDDMVCDSQGRVVIPQGLRDQAKLNGEVVVLGCGDRLEIWNKNEWLKYTEYPDSYNAQRREAVEKAYRLMTGEA